MIISDSDNTETGYAVIFKKENTLKIEEAVFNPEPTGVKKTVRRIRVILSTDIRELFARNSQ